MHSLCLNRLSFHQVCTDKGIVVNHRCLSSVWGLRAPPLWIETTHDALLGDLLGVRLSPEG